MRSTFAKKAARVLAEAERSTRYSFTGNKKNEIEDSNVVLSESNDCYCRLNLLQVRHEKLFEALKGCGKMNIKMNIGNGSEL